MEHTSYCDIVIKLPVPVWFWEDLDASLFLYKRDFTITYTKIIPQNLKPI